MVYASQHRVGPKKLGERIRKNALQNWLRTYTLPEENPKKVALILAGNIPMVGFHDLICIWVSGHTGQVKCASKDKILLPYMTRFLERETGHSSFEYVEEPLTKYDAVIATGSNNAARYFEHYRSGERRGGKKCRSRWSPDH